MELKKNKISVENVRNTLKRIHYYDKNSEKVEFKMKNQTPLTNMEGRWVHSTKEAFDALVGMGCESINPNFRKDKKYIEVLDFGDRPEIYQVKEVEEDSKQAYYHNGYFYDEPYEEFTITEEKVPFPELEDIEWVMVDAPEWWTPPMNLNKCYFGEKYINLSFESYNDTKILYENSKDFKVTWKLKEKINRNLHDDRPLAFAIGRWLVEGNSVTGIPVNEKYFLQGVMVFDSGVHCILKDRYGEYYSSSRVKVSINDDYVIPDQVLQWMKEYQEQVIK